MPDDMQGVLRTHELEIWRGDRPLISGLSFSANAGDIIHVVGPNGSGKTTLLRCLAGLTLPDAGSYRWFGREFRSHPDAETRARIQYLGHHDALKGGLTPVENLRSLDALRSGEAGLDIATALNRAGVSHRSETACRFLSAGQRRRTGLARLLLRKTPVWLLDEPFTSLDVKGVAMVTDWMQAQADAGGLVMLSTHQPLPADIVTATLELEGAQ